MLAFDYFIGGKTNIFRTEYDLSIGIDRKELTSRILEYCSHCSGKLVQLCFFYIIACYIYITLHISLIEMRYQTVYQPYNSRFSRSGQTAEKKHLTSFYGK